MEIEEEIKKLKTDIIKLKNKLWKIMLEGKTEGKEVLKLNNELESKRTLLNLKEKGL